MVVEMLTFLILHAFHFGSVLLFSATAGFEFSFQFVSVEVTLPMVVWMMPFFVVTVT